MMSHIPFSDLVKERRTALGMSQARLAELAGRSPATVRSWERGSTRPNDPEVVVTLAAVLGVPEDSLREAAGLPPASPVEEPAVDSAGAFFDDPEAEYKAWQRVVDESAPVEETHEDSPEVPETETMVATSDAAAVSDEVVDLEEPQTEVAARPEEESVAVPTAPEKVPAELRETVREPAEPAPARDRPTGEMAANLPDPGPAPDLPAATTVAEPPAQAPQSTRPIPPAPSPAPEHGEKAVSVPVAAARAVTTEPVPAAPAPVARSYLEDPNQMITYWLRAGMTVVLAIFLLIVFIWAVRHLGESLGEVLELFKAGA